MRASLPTIAIVLSIASAARADEQPVRAEPAAAFDAFVAAYKAGLPKGGAEAMTVLARHAAALGADCARGSDLACAILPDVYGAAARQARADRKIAAAVLDKPCQAGDQIDCALAAEAFDDPGGTSKETPRAIEGLVAACKKGTTQACLRAAIIRLGAGIAHPALSEGDAKTHLERACQAGYPEACHFLAGQVGAYVPGKYGETPNLLADARTCRLGLYAGCRTIVESLVPEPPFGCSLCQDDKLKTGEWDERCRDCSIAQCKKEHCCPTCKDRGSFACCDGEEVHAYPEVAPALDPAVARRAAETAKRTTARGRAIFKAGCERGLADWCRFVTELDAGVARIAP